MDAVVTEVLNRGIRVGLSVVPYGAEVTDFTPLQDALAEVAATVAAIEGKQATQETDTTPTTIGVDAAREAMARATEPLSNRLVAYALVTGNTMLRQQVSLSYSDVRYGDATEDLNAVRALVARAEGLPADVRKKYKITADLLQAPKDAANAFEAAEKLQITTKADSRLATMSLPELDRYLRQQLEIGQRLVTGMKGESAAWADLCAAYTDANRTRKVAGTRRTTDAPRVVKKLHFQRQDAATRVLDKQNFGPAYTLTIKNESPTDLLLWMGYAKKPFDAEAAPATAFRCPAGQASTVRRDALGAPEARYLTAKFAASVGGDIRIAIRRVVEK